MAKINRNLIDRFARFAIGADEEVLSLCPQHEQRKVLNKAALVIIPAALALVSGRFAAQVFTTNPWVVNGAAAAWAVLIFMLDRSIVMQTANGQMSLSLLLRASMAVVLSLLVTEPIVQRIFLDPIVHREQLKTAQISAEAEHEISVAEAKMRVELEKCQAEADRLRKAYEMEMNGTGGSSKIGIGPIALRMQGLYQEKVAELNTMGLQMQERLEQIRQQKEAEKKEKIQAVAKGLSGRLITLHEIMDGNWAINWAVWLMRILFFLVEIMPLTLKFRAHDEDAPDIYEDMAALRTKEQTEAVLELAELRKQTDHRNRQLVLLEQKTQLENKILHSLANSKRIQIAHILERQRAMEYLKEEAAAKFDLIQESPEKKAAHQHQAERMADHYQRSLFQQYMRFSAESIAE